MLRRCSRLVLMIFIAASAARAEMRLLATATTDSYRSLTFGISAFCQAAEPFLLLCEARYNFLAQLKANGGPLVSCVLVPW